MNALRIRRAEAHDCDALGAIARSAKAAWGYPQAALDAWAQELTVTAESVARHPTFAAELDGRVAGFYQSIVRGTACELEHLWVAPEHMRHGVGRALLAHALRHAADSGFAQLQVDADPHAEGFYLRCGARRTGAVAAPLAGSPQRVRPQFVIDCHRTAALQ